MLVRLAGRACGAIEALFAKRHPVPVKAAAVEQPSLVAAPHFATARFQDGRRSTRVA